MRLVFVNNTHPSTPHVSGMRLFYFAKALAKRGHQVVLLTGAPPGEIGTDTTDPGLVTRLQSHDWSEPIVLSVVSASSRVLSAIRTGRVPALFRKAMTAWQFVVHGGVFSDWTHAAKPIARQLAATFKPDLVWATFGNTSNLTLGQYLAKQAECPWVIDVKDNWSHYTPPGLRFFMASKFADAAGWTSNARHHQMAARRWLKLGAGTVIYSGVSAEFYERLVSPATTKQFDLTLIGSVRDRVKLDVYLGVVREWLASLPSSECKSIRFVYAGSDTKRINAALDVNQLDCATYIAGQIDLPHLANLLQTAFANTYITAEYTFHHKLLEMLACGRPVICFPVEKQESLALTTQIDTKFTSCSSPEEIRNALESAWVQRTVSRSEMKSPQWRWDDFAENLENVFLKLALARED